MSTKMYIISLSYLMTTMGSHKTEKKIKTQWTSSTRCIYVKTVQTLHSIYMSQEPPFKRQLPWIIEYMLHVHIYICVCVLNSVYTFMLLLLKLLINALHIKTKKSKGNLKVMNMLMHTNNNWTAKEQNIVNKVSKAKDNAQTD